MTLHRHLAFVLRAIALVALVAVGLTPGVAASAVDAADVAGSAHAAPAPSAPSELPTPAPAPAPEGAAKTVADEPTATLAPAVSEALADQDQVPVIIQLREQADLDVLARQADHAAAREESSAALQSTDDEAHERGEQARRHEVAQGLQAVADVPSMPRSVPCCTTPNPTAR